MFSSGSSSSGTATKAKNLDPWPVNTTTGSSTGSTNSWINQDLTGETVKTG